MRRLSTTGRSFGGMKKPGQPIHVKLRDFLKPDRAETSPPDDILKWYSPAASLLMVIGRRLETTMRWPPWPMVMSGGASGGEDGCVVGIFKGGNYIAIKMYKNLWNGPDWE